MPFPNDSNASGRHFFRHSQAVGITFTSEQQLREFHRLKRCLAKSPSGSAANSATGFGIWDLEMPGIILRRRSAAEGRPPHPRRHQTLRRRLPGQRGGHRADQLPDTAPPTAVRKNTKPLRCPALVLLLLIEPRGEEPCGRKIAAASPDDTSSRESPRSLPGCRAPRRGGWEKCTGRGTHDWDGTWRSRYCLPAFSASTPDRLRRFEQEARCGRGALDHPNILAIHDIGNHDGSCLTWLSELLEGGDACVSGMGRCAAVRAAGARLRDSGRTRPRRGARERDRPPGPEAREPVRDEGRAASRSWTSALPS